MGFLEDIDKEIADTKIELGEKHRIKTDRDMFNKLNLSDEDKAMVLAWLKYQGLFNIRAGFKVREEEDDKPPHRHFEQNEEADAEWDVFFDTVDPKDPEDMAYKFGTWLNLYFRQWSYTRSTWVDAEGYGYNTKELLEEFKQTYIK